MKLNVKKLFFVVLLCLLSGIILFFRTPLSVDTSLTSLVNVKKEENDISDLLLNKYSLMLNVVVEADEFDSGKRAIEYLYSELLSRGFDDSNIKYKLKNLSFDEIVKFFKDFKYNFLTKNDRVLISNSEYDEIKKNIEEKLLYSWSPLLVDLEDDHFLMLNNYILSMFDGKLNWSEKDGVIWQEKNGKNYFLLSVSVHPMMEEMIRDVYSVKQLVDSLDESVFAFVVGGPLHTVASYEHCKSQILFISIISVIFVVSLMCLLFRKISIIFSIVMNLFIAFWSACVCLFLMFNKVHFLSFAFGTTLIGICIDYSFHYFYNCRNNDVKKCVKNILFSFVTTVLCFVPLIFSSMELLRQVAVFTIGGLVATFILILCQYYSLNSCDCPVVEDAVCSCRLCFSKVVRGLFLFVSIILIVIGTHFLHFDNAITDFYKPNEKLFQFEKKFLDLNGTKYSSFLVIHGSNLEDILLFDEFIKDYNEQSFLSVSSILPSKSRQFDNVKLFEKIYSSDLTLWLRNTFNLQNKIMQNDVQMLDESIVRKVFPDLFSQFLFYNTSGDMVEIIPVSQNVNIPTSLTANAFIFNLQDKMRYMLNVYSRESYLLLGFSFLCLFAFLFYVYKFRAFIYLLPSFISVLMTISVLGLLGFNISFFSLLSLFIVVGLSMDYTIFHLDNGAEKNVKPVFYSFLTSFVSFGLLMFVDFYLVKIMGMTIFIGLGFSYLLSLFVFGNVCSKIGDNISVKDNVQWFDVKEQSVGRVRLLFLWCVYKLFRLSGLYFFVNIIFPFIFVFAKQARGSSKKYIDVLNNYLLMNNCKKAKITVYNHIKNYALSLVDKVCCLCDKNQLFRFYVEKNLDSDELMRCLQNGRGVFFISSHIGNVEILADILPWWMDRLEIPVGQCRLNAFMQVSHTGVFHQFIEKRAVDKRFRLWSTETLDFGEIMEIYEELSAGNPVLMAGDRVAAENPDSIVNVQVLGRNCKLPMGVFKFAKMMKVPVFAIFVVRVGKVYKLCVESLDTNASIQEFSSNYAKILEKYILEYPDQWYNFYDYFE